MIGPLLDNTNAADKGVMLLAVALLITLYITLWGNSSSGEVAYISVADGDSLIVPLEQDERFEIRGKQGTSIIEVKNRQIRFIEGPCQGKQCVIAGWLQSDGQTAACLPNGISIQIKGRDSRFDAVNF